MGRQKIIEKIEKNINVNDEEGVFLVIYDFYKENVNKIPERFYKNLYLLFEKYTDCHFIQKSVIECMHLKSAFIIRELVRHYGGNVSIYRVYEKI
ncbi:MAG: hypothetical protein DRJ64_02325 [Thermoprotei archaeon]|nr:MAG: hypothetical protein B6U94_04145 [Thermofilum sp. ex4484_79]RLF07783.1 MAG: hypothetical protein DRJ64_02325 [Thermoprotei archaeon]